MAILDGLVVFVMLQEMYISCYMHEIPLKICITTQVNHKIVGPKNVFFHGDFNNISKYYDKRNVTITSVTFPFLFESNIQIINNLHWHLSTWKTFLVSHNFTPTWSKDTWSYIFSDDEFKHNEDGEKLHIINSTKIQKMQQPM